MTASKIIIKCPGLVVVSEANRRDHWKTRYKRFQAQAMELAVIIHNEEIARPTPPATIALTRIGIQTLDSDNLASAFKGVRDMLAKWIGIDDGDPLLTWTYHQERGKPGIRIEITPESGTEKLCHAPNKK